MTLGLVVWRSVGGASAVIPADGCVDLILRDDEVSVAGPSTRSIITLPDSHDATVGLRLPPGHAAHLLGVPLSHLADTKVALDDVLPGRRSELIANTLREIACGHQSPVALVSLAEPPSGEARWLGVVRCCALAAVPASSVGERLGWSGRTLRRRTLAAFGYGYATLVRIERARRAHSLLRSGSSVSAAAMLAGYADQPHLSREFRRLVGKTPGQFASNLA